MLAFLLLSNAASGQTATPASEATSAIIGGPVRLRQPTQADTGGKAVAAPNGAPNAAPSAQVQPVAAPPVPSEFELYVRNQVGGSNVSRFGNDLLIGMLAPTDGADYNPLVPPDYVLRAGDELVVTLWGSVDADLRLQVDRSGRISIPRVGPVMVSGVRYADLPDVISKRVGQVFKNFQLSVSLGQLRGLRVYVTGFVVKPGAQVVSSLSTLAQALMRAGGPSPAGSFRQVQLRRGNAVITTFDLYDLLIKGDRNADLRLEADDVIHVGPLGTQVAIVGSVNRPSIFELKPGETLSDVLRMAGGFSAVADTKRLALERFEDRGNERVTQVQMPGAGQLRLASGDLLRAFNLGDVLQSAARQNTRVRIEGEVAKPGEYVLPPSSTIADALREAGGASASAYLYAAEFTRESVRQTQQHNYDRALRDYEAQLNSAATTRRASTVDEASVAAASTVANQRLLEQLRTLKPSGRIVFQTNMDSTTLPDLVLEDGDRLFLPKRPNTVGIFGSVFSTGNYLHLVTRTVGDYLRLAGGPTKGADEASVFVIRANGTVSSSLQETGYFKRGNQIAGLPAEPGDTIFVPEEINKVTWVQNAKDWTLILYQFGVGLAGIKSAVR